MSENYRGGACAGRCLRGLTRWHITLVWLAVAFHVLTVSTVQAQGLEQPITTTTMNVDKGFGSWSFDVVDPAGAGWLLDENASFIDVTGGSSGRGPGRVTFNVSFNAGKARAAVIRAGNHLVTVIQAGSITSSCHVALSPAVQTIGSAPTTTTFSVAPQGCSGWLTSNDETWLTLQGGFSGTGPGTVAVRASANSTVKVRGGVIGVNGSFVTVVQGSGSAMTCPPGSFTVTPTSLSLASGGGTASLFVNGPSGCTAVGSSNAPWVSVPPKANLPATLLVTVQPNTTPQSRSALLTVADRQVTVTQAALVIPCTFAVQPLTAAVPAGGGNATITVSASRADCAWSATAPSGVSLSRTSGTGSTTLTATIGANPSSLLRSLTIGVAGQTLTMQQPGVPCTPAVVPAALTASSGGGSLTARLTTPDGCTFTVVPNGVSVSPLSGSGSATLTIQVPPSPTINPRAFSFTVAVKSTVTTIPITQAGRRCEYSLSATSLSLPRGGASVSLQVQTLDGCPRTVTTSASWLSVTSGGQGTGPGTVSLTAVANPLVTPRTAAVTIVTGVSIGVTQTGAPPNGSSFNSSNQAVPITARYNTAWYHGDGSVNVSVGTPGGQPLAVDFDADGVLDRAQFNGGRWTVRPSTAWCPPRTTFASWGSDGFPFCTRDFGLPGDQPLRINLDGAWGDDFGVYRPANHRFYVLTDTGTCPAGFPVGEYTGDGLPICVLQWGLAGDTMVVADFDADGRDDVAAFRPAEGTWYFHTTSGACPNGRCIQQWGLPGDIPIAKKFAGTGTAASIVVYRPSTGWWYLASATGQCPGAFQHIGPAHDGLTYCGRQFGLPTIDEPALNDWDGDGIVDIGVWRTTDGFWYVLPSSREAPLLFSYAFALDGWPVYNKQFGLKGDVPIFGAR